MDTQETTALVWLIWFDLCGDTTMLCIQCAVYSVTTCFIMGDPAPMYIRYCDTVAFCTTTEQSKNTVYMIESDRIRGIISIINMINGKTNRTRASDVK